MRSRLSAMGLVTVLLVACGGAGQGESRPSSPGVGPKGNVAEGEALIEQGEFEKARDLFEGIVSESPDNPKAQYYLGVAKKNLGDVDAAISHYEKAIALDEKLMDAHINLGLLLLDKGDLKRAESELGVYLAASPDAADAHFNYGLVQEAMDNLDKADEHYAKAAELDPEDPSPLFGLGDLARKRGKPEAAVEMYEKARALDSNMPELLFIEGQTLIEMKESKRACEVLTSLLEISPVDLVVVVEAGKMIAKYDNACAINLYRGAISRDEGFAAAHFYLANTLVRDKSFEEAASHYEWFLKIAPDDSAADAAKKRLEACKANLSK